jgi:HEPN domain-containing protein
MSAELGNAERAAALIRDAWESFRRGGGRKDSSDYSGAIEAYQHCIELSIKSLYQLQGMAYSFEHDPTKDFNKVYEGLMNRIRDLPEVKYSIQIWKQRLARARWISKMSSELHQLAMYAFCDVAAKDFFNSDDVDYLKKIAENVRSTADFFIIQLIVKAKEKVN